MSVQSQVHRVLDLCFAFEGAIDALKADSAVVKAREQGRDALKALLLPAVASWSKYQVPLIVSESNANKGQKVMDSTHPKFDAAKKALNRLLAALMGKVDAQKEEVEIPEELLAAAAKLAKLAQKYEGARSLASRALATAFAA